MDYFYDFLFSITFDGDYVYLFSKLLFFIALWLILLYTIYFVFTKMVKSKLHKDFQLKLNFLWTLGIFQILVAIYFFYLIRLEGLRIFNWNDPNFYLGIFPQLIVFLGTVFLFLNSWKNYNQLVKNL